MPRPKPDFEAVQVLLRLHPDDVAMIDKLRGDRSRAEWIKGLVTVKLASLLPDLPPKAVANVMRNLRETEPSVVQVGPAKPKPGARLKKR